MPWTFLGCYAVRTYSQSASTGDNVNNSFIAAKVMEDGCLPGGLSLSNEPEVSGVLHRSVEIRGVDVAVGRDTAHRVDNAE